MLGTLGSLETRALIEDSTNAAWVEPGYLLFGRGGNLMAVRFDADALQVAGAPAPLTAEKLSYWEPKNFIPFTASDDGTLVFLPEAIRQSVLRWYDRGGRPLEPLAEPGYHRGVSLSPDGSRIAWVQGPPQSSKQDVWVREIAAGLEYRVTLESGEYAEPRFSPDGSRIAFVCQPKRVQDICVKTVESGEPPELFLETPNWTGLGDWLPDGRSLVVVDQHPETQNDILLFDPEDAAGLRPLLRKPFVESEPAVSSDGRWYVYTSDESGRPEVYVRELRESSQQWRLSLDGGSHPRWRRDGREVFYVAPDGNLMALAIETSPVFRAGAPQILFALPAMPDSQNPIFEDVTADGQRVIVNLPIEERAGAAFRAIFNWTSLPGG